MLNRLEEHFKKHDGHEARTINGRLEIPAGLPKPVSIEFDGTSLPDGRLAVEICVKRRFEVGFWVFLLLLLFGGWAVSFLMSFFVS